MKFKRIYESSHCNFVCALICPAKCKTLITGVYGPPYVSSYDSRLLTPHLIQINDTANVRIIVNDFNLAYTDWLNSANTKRDGISDTLQATLDDLGFFNVSRSRYTMIKF